MRATKLDALSSIEEPVIPLLHASFMCIEKIKVVFSQTRLAMGKKGWNLLPQCKGEEEKKASQTFFNIQKG